MERSVKDDFDAVHEALQRPYARMDGDYNDPIAIPSPILSRPHPCANAGRAGPMLSIAADKPEPALRELTLLHQIFPLARGRPTGKPMTMVRR